MNRRIFLQLATSLGLPWMRTMPAEAATIQGSSDWNLSEAEWKRRLSPGAFAVLRKESTERPFSSPLVEELRPGRYHCAGCDLPLFSSKAKYESGTGWPSFWDSLPGAIGTRMDLRLLIPRTEYHCKRCGGHQGHRFGDGPRPTGLRYCNNGIALRFQPQS
jgi:peptide-methionine (R)-S-oxide reductase